MTLWLSYNLHRAAAPGGTRLILSLCMLHYRCCLAGCTHTTAAHHHHHQITKLSHSINAIGPAPHHRCCAC
jgi:hypothetical protein